MNKRLLSELKPQSKCFKNRGGPVSGSSRPPPSSSGLSRGSIRLARAETREAMLMDYVKFAKAKGLSNACVVLVHVFKNIMIPVVTVLGLELGNVIAFSVITETIFAWPGMGKLIIDSINVLDRPVIVAYLLMTVAMFIVLSSPPPSH